MDEHEWRALFSPDGLVDDLLAAMNASELARRQFRDIARIAGLIFQGYPGRGKTARQLQASSGLIFDTINRYDPHNRLLTQARREVLDSALEVERLRSALKAIASAELVIHDTERFTPLAFPLWAERLRNRLTTQRWQDRVAKMVAQLERAADRT